MSEEKECHIQHGSITRAPHDDENPYTMMSNAFFRDPLLHPAVKGMIGYLLTMVKDWKINTKQLINYFSPVMGRDAVYSMIKQACESPYMQRVEKRNAKGHVTYIYHISESGKFKKQSPVPENPDEGFKKQSTISEKPYRENPIPEKPYRENPDREKPDYKKEHKLRKNIDISHVRGEASSPPANESKQSIAHPNIKSPSAPSSPSAAANQKIKKVKSLDIETKKKVAPEVYVTPTQESSLIEKCGGNLEKLSRVYNKLSEWKIDKQANIKSDYKAICTWVISAVESDESQHKTKYAGATGEHFQKISTNSGILLALEPFFVSSQNVHIGVGDGLIEIGSGPKKLKIAVNSKTFVSEIKNAFSSRYRESPETLKKLLEVIDGACA